jgi:hypothetical protein
MHDVDLDFEIGIVDELAINHRRVDRAQFEGGVSFAAWSSPGAHHEAGHVQIEIASLKEIALPWNRVDRIEAEVLEYGSIAKGKRRFQLDAGGSFEQFEHVCRVIGWQGEFASPPKLRNALIDVHRGLHIARCE